MSSVFRNWVRIETQTLYAVGHFGQSNEVFDKYSFSGLDGFLTSYLVFVQICLVYFFEKISTVLNPNLDGTGVVILPTIGLPLIIQKR